MEYILIGIAVIAFIAFGNYVNLTSFTRRQSNENLKEENEHRDLNDVRRGQDSFKNRMK